MTSKEFTEQEKEILIGMVKEYLKYPVWIFNSIDNIKCAGEAIVIYESIIKKLEQ